MNVDTISATTIETNNSINSKNNISTEKNGDVKSFKEELAENKKVETDKIETTKTETNKTEKAANEDKTKLSSKEAVKAVATQDKGNNKEINSQEITNIIANNMQNININENVLLAQQDKNTLSNTNITNNTLTTSNEKIINDSLSELNEKIIALNNLQVGKVSKTSALTNTESMKSLTMSNEDINFFLELTNTNQTVTEISGETIAKNMVTFAETAKTEMVQKSVPVSKALMESLAESMQTNKPFRIDFDSDVAVIMKVDKNGVLSANFIPGSTAVEAYLRNNMGLLKQAFAENNLEYNELTYSKNKNQEQHKQRQNNKENDNE